MRVEEIQILAAEVLVPPPDLSVSEWADQNARLSSEFAAERGEWRTDRAPYQRAIMDALSPSHPAETVVLMCAAQMGKTSMLSNFIGYIIDLDPGPILLVQPREVDAEAFSKDRLAPMLRDTPCLRGKVAEARSRDSNNTILHKKFLGGSITLAAASSPAGLAMRSIRYCLLDEVDRYPASAGSEGDPVNLAITRTANFWNRKIVLCSTPTIKGASRIEAAYLESNQQSYWVPCPHCGEFQVLRWDNLVWPKGEPGKAEYCCEHCAKLIGDWQKHWMLKHGEWRAAHPEREVAGFWINGLYSPWRKWGALATKFLADRRSPETLREFVNTVLAEPWDDQAASQVSEDDLLARREQYGPQLPDGAALLTAGVDVQDDRIEVSVWAWGRGEESWLMEHRVIPGDPTVGPEHGPWPELDRYLSQPWMHPRAGQMHIAAVCVDAGFATAVVSRFCEARVGRRVWAIKGVGGPVPAWPRRQSRTQRGRVYLIGVDSLKSTITARLRTASGAGATHFPVTVDRDYFEQLTSEFLRTTYKHGRPVRTWERRKGRRAEALDCAVYAYAATFGLAQHGIMIEREADRLDLIARTSPAPAPQPPQRDPWLLPRKGWLS